MPAISLVRTASNRLSGHVERFWQSAQTAKQPLERQMLTALRQRTGVYEPEELALIREQGGSEIYMMITAAKCMAAESWLREILLPDSGKAWGLEPTPMPELPPPVIGAVIQAVANMAIAAGWQIDDARIDERLLKIKTLAMRRMKDWAAQVAERHELKIADQFAEGGFEEALSEAIYDLVTFPAAFIKGPFQRMRKIRKWQAGPNGQWMPAVSDGLRLEWERRSPFDIFPAAAMRDIQRGNLIDRYRFHRQELQSLIDAPGYSKPALIEIIERYGDKGYRSTRMNDLERATLEFRGDEEDDPEGTIEALNFWGSCSGHMLKEWGYNNKQDVGPIEPHKEYQVEVWKTAGVVFKAVLNPDSLGEKPYSKASFNAIPGAFWGQAVPDLIRDTAKMCNAAARAISNNAAIASGPQVEINVDRLADGETVSKPYPWKLYQTTTDMTGNNQPAIRFTQPNSIVHDLLVIYTHFERVGDNVTGFPAFTYGDSRVGGAGRTASGLSQLMGNVGKGVRRVVGTVDLGLIRPNVTGAYNWNMEYDPDPSIKFDLRAVSRGVSAMLARDSAQLRRKETLQALLNPLDAQIIGVEGRSVMLRETLKGENFPVDEIMPDKLELELIAASMPQPYELLGKTGPNAPASAGAGPTPGVAGGGGTPEGAQTMDLAGNPPNGVEARQASQGYADGGTVLPPVRRRFRLVRAEDGSVDAEEVTDDN
jgi:hypothetical protein